MTHVNDQGQRLERVISGVVLLLLLIGCIAVLWPFLSSLLWAVVLCSSTWKVYQHVLRWTGGKKNWSATLMTLLVSIVLLVPFLIVGFTLAKNMDDLSAAIRKIIDAGPPDPPTWLARVPMGGSITEHWKALASDSQQLIAELRNLVAPAGSLLLSGSLSLGRGLVELTISIIIAFFIYRDGIPLAERTRSAARRLAGDRGDRLLELAGATVRSVVYGILGTAIVQGVVAGIGFFIASVPGAMLLALLTFFLSVVPMGPPLIWIPVSIWLFYKGSIGWGIFMVIWGILVSSIDNVVKPWLISQGTDLPFILILFGVIGGAVAFGFIGVFIGPTLLAVGYRLITEWTSVIAPRTDTGLP